jgi:hypothetical protein
MRPYTTHSGLREGTWRISAQAEPRGDLVPLESVAIQGEFRGGSEVVPKSGTAVLSSIHTLRSNQSQRKYDDIGRLWYNGIAPGAPPPGAAAPVVPATRGFFYVRNQSSQWLEKPELPRL